MSKIKFDFRIKTDNHAEKYDFPVLTQKAYSGVKGAVNKFVLNKAALKALDYDPENLRESKISIGIRDNQLVIVNTSSVETEHQFNVNLNRSINSGFLLKHLTKRFKTDPSVENEFKLNVEKDDDSGFYFATLEKLEEVVDK